MVRMKNHHQGFGIMLTISICLAGLLWHEQRTIRSTSGEHLVEKRNSTIARVTMADEWRNSSNSNSETRTQSLASLTNTSSNETIPSTSQNTMDIITAAAAAAAQTAQTATVAGSLSSLHPLSTYILNQEKVFLFELGYGTCCGFGSIVINMLLLHMYFHDAQGRDKLVVDETSSRTYRRDTSHGMFRGYFDTTFPALYNSTDEYATIKQEVLQRHHHHHHGTTNTTTTQPQLGKMGSTKFVPVNSSKYWRFTHSNWFTEKYTNDKFKLPWYEERFRNATLFHPVVKVTQMFARQSFLPISAFGFQYYNIYDERTRKGQTERELILFHRMSQLLCQSIRLNDIAKNRITNVLENSGIPRELWNWTMSSFPVSSTSSRPPETSSSSSSDIITVGFHIRRTDKVAIQEARAYEAYEYVDKLVQDVVPTVQDQSRIRYCFVATDDYNVISDLQDSLSNASIPCTLYTLTTKDFSNTRTGDDFILLLAQMQILIHSTYFIGTFSSNIGGLVALYRSCSYHDEQSQHQHYHHYQEQTQTGTPQESSIRYPHNNHNNQRGVHDETTTWYDSNYQLDETQKSERFFHYYHSYGVDNEYWYIY